VCTSNLPYQFRCGKAVRSFSEKQFTSKCKRQEEKADRKIDCDESIEKRFSGKKRVKFSARNLC